MSLESEAIALWLFFESRGIKASIASIGRALRDQGMKFRDEDLYACLKSHREEARKKPEEKIALAGRVGKSSGYGFAGANNELIISNTSGTNVPSVTSETNVSSVRVSHETPESLFPEEIPPKTKRRHEPSPADLAAYAILNAAYPVVAKNRTLSMTMTAWKQRNKAAALDLHRLGKSPDDVAAMFVAAYADPFANGLTMIGKLQELWPKIESRLPPKPADKPRDLAAHKRLLESLQ